MNGKTATTQWQIVTWLRLLFGLHLVYSGGAYVLFGYTPAVFGDTTSLIGRFHIALDEVGIYPFVKYMEFILGLLVLANRFVPLAAVAELPITIVIFFINVFVNGPSGPSQYRQLFTGTQELFLNGSVMLAYGAYYRTMLFPKTRPQWLWNELDVTPTPANAERASAFRLGTPGAWAFFLIFFVIVVSASWFLGTSARRLPPRDWLPPILAFVWMLGAYAMSAKSESDGS